MKAEESYDTIAESFKDAFDDINELVANPFVTIDDEQYEVMLYFSCDYKVRIS